MKYAMSILTLTYICTKKTKIIKQGLFPHYCGQKIPFLELAFLKSCSHNMTKGSSESSVKRWFLLHEFTKFLLIFAVMKFSCSTVYASSYDIPYILFISKKVNLANDYKVANISKVFPSHCIFFSKCAREDSARIFFPFWVFTLKENISMERSANVWSLTLLLIKITCLPFQFWKFRDM